MIEPNDTLDGAAPANLIAKGKVDLRRGMVFELCSGASS